MAPNGQLASCKVVPGVKDEAFIEWFPVCNRNDRLTIDDLGTFAERSLSYKDSINCLPRSDFLICIRALKVTEQVFLIRSRLSLGPPSVTLSAARIMESIPS